MTTTSPASVTSIIRTGPAITYFEVAADKVPWFNSPPPANPMDTPPMSLGVWFSDVAMPRCQDVPPWVTGDGYFEALPLVDTEIETSHLETESVT